MKQDLPLVCNLDVFTPSEHKMVVRSIEELYRSIQNIKEVENGFEFALPNESEVIMRAAEFISNEQRCCPFLEFRLSVKPKKAPVTLELTGPEGTKDFLQAEFREAFA